MPDVQVILPDGRRIVAQIPDGTENPREFVINELTSRGLLGLPPLTTEQQAEIEALPGRKANVPIGFTDRPGRFGFEFERRVAPPTAEERAKAAGIGFEGAPAGARLEAGFAADPAQGIDISLQQQFGQEVITGQRPEFGGRTTFIDPETGQEQFFNPPGTDIGDIAALPGAATVVVPEVIGGITGAAFGGLPGGVAGAAAGAGLGEAFRLEIGKFLDVNPDLSASEQTIRAASEAGQAAVIDALTLGVGAGVRRLARGAPAPRAPSGVLDEFGGPVLEEGLARSKLLQSEFRETFGVDLPLNTEQVLRDVADVQSRELAGATALVRGRPPGKQLRVQRREQAAAMEQAAEQVLGREGVSTVAAGRQLQQVARRAPQQAISEQRRILQEFDVSLLRQEQISVVAEIDAGAAIRETLEGERDALEKRFDVRYDQFREATGNIQVDMAGVNEIGRVALKETDADVFQSLAPENRSILLEAIRTGRKPRTGLEFGPDGLLREVSGIENVGIEFSVLQRALSDLRTERRLIRKKLSPRRNIGQVNQLIESLEDARSAALRGRSDIAKQIADLEADFAAARTRVDRGLVGRLLQPAEGGGFKLADDKVIPTILRNPDLARKMADVFSDPKFQFQPGARLEIQQGLMAALRDGSIDKKTKRMTAAKFAEFRTKNKTVFNAFFDPVTNQRMKTLNGALAEGERLTTRLEKITTDLNRTFGMNLQKYDPSQVMNKIFSGRARDIPENLRRARIIAKRDPVVFEEFQKATLAQLRRASTKATSQEPGKLNFTGLIQIVQNKEMVDELSRIMGPRWRRGFEVLVDALDTTKMRPTDAAVIQGMQAAGEPGSVIQGILRVTFPPLTREGRALTGILRANRESVVRSLDNVLADPELMVELTRLRGTRNRRAVFRTLEAIGLGHIALALQEDENGR